MNDQSPFILSFQVDQDRYVLSDPQSSPVSIRDQVVRSQTLVDRLPQRYFDGGEERPLVVVGAGVGGVTFAIGAAERGARRIFMVDHNNWFFSLQAKSPHRLIAPNQYDWPAVHWRGEYSLDSFLLPLATKSAADLAEDWTYVLLEAAHRHPGVFKIAFDSIVDLDPAPSTTVRIIHCCVASSTVRATVNATAIIFATGFGGERTCVDSACERSVKVACLSPLCPSREELTLTPDCSGLGVETSRYRSYYFWEEDSFGISGDLPPRDSKSSVEADPPSVIVSGGGDGALQDFIRITTGGKGPGEVLQALPEDAISDFTLLAGNEYEQLEKLWRWGDDEGYCIAARQVEKFAERCIESYLQEREDFRDRMATIVDSMATSVDLIHPHGHFERCYPINSFVCLLILTYREMVGSGDTPPISRRSWTRLARVVPVDHECSHRLSCDDYRPRRTHGVLMRCWSHRPEVSESVPCQYILDATDYNEIEEKCNLLVIRHGIRQSGNGRRAARSRLPSWIPS